MQDVLASNMWSEAHVQHMLASNIGREAHMLASNIGREAHVQPMR